MEVDSVLTLSRKNLAAVSAHLPEFKAIFNEEPFAAFTLSCMHARFSDLLSLRTPTHFN